MRTFLPVFAAFLLITIGLAPTGEAQETFQVTVDNKSGDAPNPGGWPEAFYIDGVEQDVLTLERGNTYVFQMNDVAPIHAFYISTDSGGGDGGSSSWDDGVEGNGADENETLTFEVPASAPDLLYYQCEPHLNMGWELNIIGTSETEEDPNAGFDLSVVSQNPGASRVTVSLALAEPSDVSVEVFDIRGRRVDVLHEGVLAADGDHRFEVGQNLRPGVYMVRATDGERMAELNVTIAR